MRVFFLDLWLDLREKRLAPLAILLLAAIVAVPIVLANDQEEPPPPPTPTTASAVSWRNATILAQNPLAPFRNPGVHMPSAVP